MILRRSIRRILTCKSAVALKQFGEAIRATITEVLSRYDVRGVQLNDRTVRRRSGLHLRADWKHTGARQRRIAALPGGMRQ